MGFSISGLFQNQNSVPVNTSQGTAGSAAVGRNPVGTPNQSAANLTPGSSISGQIVSAQDGNVTIRLSDSSYLTAALKGGISLQPGSQVSFLVSGNHNNQVTLSPLLTNLLASSPSVENALNAAALPINERTTAMVTQMMEEGMGIDKDSLHTMYKAIMANPDIDSGVAVRLSQMKLAINEVNANQLQTYDNLNHQISGSIEEIAKGLQDTFADMPKTDSSGAMELFDRVLKLVTETEDLTGESEDAKVQNRDGNPNGAETAKGSEESASQAQNAEGRTPVSTNTSLAEIVGKDNFEQLLKALTNEIDRAASDNGIPGENVQTDEKNAQAAQNEKLLNGEESSRSPQQQPGASGEKVTASPDNARAALQELAKGNMSSADALKLVENLMHEHKLSHKILSEPAVGKLLQNALEDKWLLKPEDVADKEKMDHFYEQLRSQTSKLSQDVSSILGKDSPLAQSTANLSQNIDFMNQLNQTFTYVQIPLKMSGQNANGDLYVYTNKKHLAKSDGSVSAFLHLDMDHLGSVDCYVTMQNEKVSTNFKVADDAVLNLIEKNIDELNERLQKRGYSLNTTVAVKEEETSVIEEMEKQLGQGSVPVSQVSFDARA